MKKIPALQVGKYDPKIACNLPQISDTLCSSCVVGLASVFGYISKLFRQNSNYYQNPEVHKLDLKEKKYLNIFFTI